MITNPTFTSRIGPDLNVAKLAPYWNEYFRYRDEATDLHSKAAERLDEAIVEARARTSPFLDAQQTISRILTAFGSTHDFHRQFGERFPFRPAQTIGMQLYAMLTAEQNDWWVFMETQHAGHRYPHGVYFMPWQSAEYRAFVVAQNAH